MSKRQEGVARQGTHDVMGSLWWDQWGTYMWNQAKMLGQMELSQQL